MHPSFHPKLKFLMLGDMLERICVATKNLTFWETFQNKCWMLFIQHFYEIDVTFLSDQMLDAFVPALT